MYEDRLPSLQRCPHTYICIIQYMMEQLIEVLLVCFDHIEAAAATKFLKDYAHSA